MERDAGEGVEGGGGAEEEVGVLGVEVGGGVGGDEDAGGVGVEAGEDGVLDRCVAIVVASWWICMRDGEKTRGEGDEKGEGSGWEEHDECCGPGKYYLESVLMMD